MSPQKDAAPSFPSLVASGEHFECLKSYFFDQQHSILRARKSQIANISLVKTVNRRLVDSLDRAGAIRSSGVYPSRSAASLRRSVSGASKRQSVRRPQRRTTGCAQGASCRAAALVVHLHAPLPPAPVADFLLAGAPHDLVHAALSAPSRAISAGPTRFRAALRSSTGACDRLRPGRARSMEIPRRMRKTHTRRAPRESPPGFKCQGRTTRKEEFICASPGASRSPRSCSPGRR